MEKDYYTAAHARDSPHGVLDQYGSGCDCKSHGCNGPAQFDSEVSH